ncbi:hydroxylamine reductase [Pararhodospirillum oryzae]|uniref:Hydroxylamine reductase n=1 Tax=Pararhodospirillum oryzae TaxID=478448 RepID=A0A512H9H9_9PROT|nr:hydroxylamine reductase [Pararhodospirillum oryzae]GEO82040.1 hydroxylamine reductase [Pararhodospirillum oryzae]
MYCFQCEETSRGTACTARGVCGKTGETAALQDLLLFVVRGMAVFGEALAREGHEDRSHDAFVRRALFATITNVGWDDARFVALVEEALARRDALRARGAAAPGGERAFWDPDALPEAAIWHGPVDAFAAQGERVGVLATTDETVRSLRELLVLGVKGIAAYAEHAAHLGAVDPAVDAFLQRALAATTRVVPVEALIALVMQTGERAVAAMALLDRAHTETYGTPTATQVSVAAGTRPGILVSGHDLRDLFELLEQTQDSGIDVYTHGEMLPAHAYPAFRRYPHLVANYGGSWGQQTTEFEAFNGPILLTTNCLLPPPPGSTYLDRLFTTDVVSYPGAGVVADRAPGGVKDFSAVIARARQCQPPTPLETGFVTTGFAHHQILAVADQVVAALKAGSVTRFVVMAGCDGRHKARDYYTQVAATLPRDAIILTAGCAKYRYNKLDLGTVGGLPRLLDAGQCNDSYSLALVALTLKEALGLDDINDLPISYDIAWYEQKAVAVLLALLHLGVKGIRLGPTLPAFLSPAVLSLLVERFGLKPIGAVDEDVAAMMAGA